MLFHLDFRRSFKLVLPIAILLSFILLVAQMKGRLEWYKNRIADLPQVFLQTQSEDPLEIIKQLCGELCDLSKEIQTGEFIGSVRANVSLTSIIAFFSSRLFRLIVTTSSRLKRRRLLTMVHPHHWQIRLNITKTTCCIMV